MPVTVEQVDEWRRSRSETEHLEFKEAKQQFGLPDLCRYCVAMANEGGGVIVLGVEDRPPRRVVATSAFRNPAETAHDVFRKVQFRVNLSEVAHPEGRIVVIEVPGRPRGAAYQIDGAYLMRVGSSLVGMSFDQLRSVLSEGQPDWIEQYSMPNIDAQDVIDLLDTQGYYELLRAPYPTERSGVLDRLVQEKLVDADGDRYSIRRIGAILLARRLQDFEDLSRKVPRVVVYSGKSKLETKLDREGIKGYAVGFRGLVRFIIEQLPQNEVIRDAIRDDVKLLPEIVIRELCANALIHQDFNITGASVMIEIFSDRIEFSNPGEPVVPVARFIDGYQSRNERLAGIMRRLGVCEEKGSGVDRVIQHVETYQLPAPDFRVDVARTVVAIFGLKKFGAMDRADRIRACYQHCALKRTMSEHMTNQSLRDRFRLPESKTAVVSQVIAQAIDEGLVKPDDTIGGSRKFARYLPFWA